MILIDTSVLSRVFRRKRPGPDELRLRMALEDLMGGDDELGVPGIVLQEVLSGIRSETQFADLERRLVTGFTMVLPTLAHHVESARLKNKCTAKGLNVSGLDCLIATLAIADRHTLFTVDSDFSAIARHSTLRLFRPAAEAE
jgi:predicted nucleic acid-binding protein